MSTLVGWWKGEDNTIDSVNGYNGTWNGTPEYMAGFVNRAFKFSILNDITLPYNSNFDFLSDPAGNFTVECYIKADNYEDNYLLPANHLISVVSKAPLFPGDTWGNFNWALKLNSDRVLELMAQVEQEYQGEYWYANGTILTTQGAITLTNWNKITLSYNAGIWGIKINDAVVIDSFNYPIVKVSNSPIIVFNNQIQLGLPTPEGFYCGLDEIKIYNDSITPIVPPTSRSITLKRDISPILFNQRTTSYRLDSFDKLQVKLVLNNKGKKSYLNNAPVEFYLNYTNDFVKYVDTTTDSNGAATINFSCQNIEYNLDSCVGYAKVTVDSVVYTSNMIRFNFSQGAGMEHEVYLYPTEIMLYSSGIINL